MTPASICGCWSVGCTNPAAGAATWVEAGAGGAGATSVFGRTGAVVAADGDYTADQIDDGQDKVMMTDVERTTLAAISFPAKVIPLSYLPHNVIVRGNNLAQRTAATDGLTWSQIKPRGIAGENRQWRRDTPTGNVMFYDTTMTGEVFVGRASAMRIEAPNALDRLTYDADENRIGGFSEDDFVRSQSAA